MLSKRIGKINITYGASILYTVNYKWNIVFIKGKLICIFNWYYFWKGNSFPSIILWKIVWKKTFCVNVVIDKLHGDLIDKEILWLEYFYDFLNEINIKVMMNYLKILNLDHF